MTQSDDQECAVWYWRYGSPAYDLADNEQEAANLAVGIEDSGEGSVVGIQFSDGRTLRCDEWPAYRAEQDRRWAQYEQDKQERAKRSPTPMREVLDPFEGKALAIEADEPAWLGIRPMTGQTGTP